MTLLQEKADQIKKEEERERSISSQISESSTLSPSITREDIKAVKGIGPRLAEILNNAGFTSLKTIIESTPETLATIKGVGQVTARKIIEASKQFLRIKNLNNFSQSHGDFKEETAFKESFMDNENDNNEETLPSANSSDAKPWFAEKFNYSRLTDSNNVLEQVKDDNEINESNDPESDFEDEDSEVLLREDSQDIIDINNRAVDTLRSAPSQAVISPEMMRESEFSLQEKETASKETLSPSQIKKLYTDISKRLELAHFDTIERIPELRTFFTGIDMLAVRHVRVTEFLDFIYLIPIKISSLKGTLILSHDAVQYNPVTSTENAYRMEKLASSYLKMLSQTEQAIASNMTNGGYLIPYLSKYVGNSISLEKSLTGKNLFFRSGPLQYKILVEPILVCDNRVGFTEKLIPFAYHKESNIHVVEQSQLTDLLQFLDQKYFLIETYTKEENALALDNNATTKFISDLRKYSAPFMFYGVTVLFVLLSQAYSVLPLLINLGYGVISFYIILVSYLYLNLYKQKLALHREFSKPYYQKSILFDETSLILINEELSPKLMEQFIFECIGNDSEFNIINKLEKDNAESFLSEKLRRKRVEDSVLFEPDIPITPRSSEGNKPIKETSSSRKNHKILDKYSSFLED